MLAVNAEANAVHLALIRYIGSQSDTLVFQQRRTGFRNSDINRWCRSISHQRIVVAAIQQIITV